VVDFCRSISRTTGTVTTMTVTITAGTVTVIVIFPVSLLECLPRAKASNRQLLKKSRGNFDSQDYVENVTKFGFVLE
jgi:hypothetical protein